MSGQYIPSWHRTQAGDRKGSLAYCFGFWYFFKLGILEFIALYIKQDILDTMMVFFYINF